MILRTFNDSEDMKKRPLEISSIIKCKQFKIWTENLH